MKVFKDRFSFGRKNNRPLQIKMFLSQKKKCQSGFETMSLKLVQFLLNIRQQLIK